MNRVEEETKPTSVEYSILRNRRFYLSIIIAFVVYLSFSTLLTKPRVWSDEAKSLEIARSFSLYRSLDIEWSSGNFTEFPLLLQSTGYPLTVLTGLIFKLFGVNVEVARITMILWILVAIFAVYVFICKLFDRDSAILSLSLIATFAPFYDSGRALVGEIPGFVFLVVALHYWLNRQSIAMAGIFFGLSVVTKPSVFLLIIPSLFVVLVIHRQRFFRNTSLLAITMIPAALMWFATLNLNPFSVDTWSSIRQFYSNPYGSKIIENISNNLDTFFKSSTLVYFAILFTAVLVARFISKKKETKKFYDFIIIYSLFAFIYYLRSPGWLRYLIIAQLLILLVMPNVVLSISYYARNKIKNFRNLRLATVVMGITITLVVIQGVHLMAFSDIPEGDRELSISRKIIQEYSNAKIFIAGSPELCFLLNELKRSCVYEFVGIPVIGRNLNLLNSLPDIVVVWENSRFYDEIIGLLNKQYEYLGIEQGYMFYSIK
jgi:4-amino-4-deoxy-L-arabinose transferase-like glycosyltransferase